VYENIYNSEPKRDKKWRMALEILDVAKQAMCAQYRFVPVFSAKGSTDSTIGIRV
jgi:hypothetical protein